MKKLVNVNLLITLVILPFSAVHASEVLSYEEAKTAVMGLKVTSIKDVPKPVVTGQFPKACLPHISIGQTMSGPDLVFQISANESKETLMSCVSKNSCSNLSNANACEPLTEVLEVSNIPKDREIEIKYLEASGDKIALSSKGVFYASAELRNQRVQEEQAAIQKKLVEIHEHNLRKCTGSASDMAVAKESLEQLSVLGKITEDEKKKKLEKLLEKEDKLAEAAIKEEFRELVREFRNEGDFDLEDAADQLMEFAQEHPQMADEVVKYLMAIAGRQIAQGGIHQADSALARVDDLLDDLESTLEDARDDLKYERSSDMSPEERRKYRKERSKISSALSKVRNKKSEIEVQRAAMELQSAQVAARNGDFEGAQFGLYRVNQRIQSMSAQCSGMNVGVKRWGPFYAYGMRTSRETAENSRQSGLCRALPMLTNETRRLARGTQQAYAKARRQEFFRVREQQIQEMRYERRMAQEMREMMRATNTGDHYPLSQGYVPMNGDFFSNDLGLGLGGGPGGLGNRTFDTGLGSYGIGGGIGSDFFSLPNYDLLFSPDP